MISAEEWELLSLFAVEPRLNHSDVPWCYQSALYEATVGNCSVSFSVAPSYHDFTLTIDVDGSRLFEFTGLGVKDIRYSAGPPESLQIHVSDTHELRFHLRPTPFFDQKKTIAES